MEARTVGHGTRPRHRGLRRGLPTKLGEAAGVVGVLQVLLGVLVVGSVLAVGAVHLPVLIVASSLALAAALLAQRLGSSMWPLPAALAGLLVIYTILQALPLPVGLLARIAPSNADVWARVLSPLGEPGPRWAPVSLDPGASLVDALKWLTYALAFSASSALALRRGAAWGIALVFVSSVVAALTTVAHGLVGTHRVFGVYQPHFEPAPWHVGPLLNPNNLAGYLGLGTLCGLGLLLARRQFVPRWLVGVGIATTVAVAVTTASRGGALALLLGVVLFIVGVALGPRAGVSRGAGAWLVLGTIGGGAVLASFAASTATWVELSDRNIDKVGLLRWVVPMVRDHASLGIGRGAFGSVFPAYCGLPGNIVYEHAENFLAEWAAGWGVPVACLAFVGFAWLFRPGPLGVRRSVVVAGAWVGVIVVLLQNLADLGLEVPAVSLAIAVVLGSLWGEKSRRRAPRDAPAPRRRRVSRLWRGSALACAVAAVVVACVRWGWRDVNSERVEFHKRVDSLGSGQAARAEIRQDLRAAMLRHPAEPYFPLVGALVAWTAQDRNPLPWLIRAIERNPKYGRAHLLTADVLAARGATLQALLELRLAVEADETLTRAAALRALQWAKDCAELKRSVVNGEAGAPMLAALAGLLNDPGRVACKESLVREALARSPRAPWPRLILATILLGHIRAGEADPRCGGGGTTCAAEVEAQASVLEQVTPETSDAARIRAQLRSALGAPDEAERMLSERCFVVVDREECLRLRVTIASEMRPASRLQPAIKDYLAVACSSPPTCADAHVTVGNLLAARADWATATSHYARATQEAPTEARLMALADAAGRAGAHAQAAGALQKVAGLRGGADEALKARIAREHELALGILRP